MEAILKTGRSTVNEYPEGIQVVIPAKKSFFVNIFLATWLMAWVYGEIVVIDRLFSNQGQTPDAFIVFYAFAWTLSGMLAIFVWLWNNRGREVIRISDDELRRSREYVWFSISKFYQARHISNLRISDLSPASLEMGGGMEFWGLAGGSITFDYKSSLGKIGLGIDEAEAGRIIEVIKARYPHF